MQQLNSLVSEMDSEPIDYSELYVLKKDHAEVLFFDFAEKRFQST